MKLTISAKTKETLVESIQQARKEGYVFSEGEPWFDFLSKKYYVMLNIESIPKTLGD